MNIQDFREKIEEANGRSLEIRALAEAENRPLKSDELEELDGIFKAVEGFEKQIATLERIENNAVKALQPQGRKTAPNAAGPEDDEDDEDQPAVYTNRNGSAFAQTPAGRRATVRVDMPTDKGKHGFKSFGDFAHAVRNAATHGGTLDNRLHIFNAATTYGQEAVGADGGFAVPPDFRQAIMQKVMGEDALISRTDQLVTSSNSITMPTDETTPWQTSGGLQVYWEGEAAQATQSKPALQSVTTRLNKLMALVPVTEELLDDAPSLDSYLRSKTPEKINFSVNYAILQGTGVGQPLGVINAPCTVSVAEEGSQTADTLVFSNIENMWNRLYAPCRPNAVWIMHQDAEAQLATMEFPGSVTTHPVYLPPGGMSASPFAMLKGRPVLTSEACNTLGDKGDIFLVDLTKYMTALKGGGIRTDVSMHLWFDQDITAYKFVLRVGGQPWWSSAISPRSGSNTRSCFVTLDERAG